MNPIKKKNIYIWILLIYYENIKKECKKKNGIIHKFTTANSK